MLRFERLRGGRAWRQRGELCVPRGIAEKRMSVEIACMADSERRTISTARGRGN